jgi:hypothetical protein
VGTVAVASSWTHRACGRVPNPCGRPALTCYQPISATKSLSPWTAPSPSPSSAPRAPPRRARPGTAWLAALFIAGMYQDVRSSCGGAPNAQHKPIAELPAAATAVAKEPEAAATAATAAHPESSGQPGGGCGAGLRHCYMCETRDSDKWYYCPPKGGANPGQPPHHRVCQACRASLADGSLIKEEHRASRCGLDYDCPDGACGPNGC